MRAKPVLLLHTLIGGFFGITMLLIPDIMSSLSGLTVLEAGLYIARHEGAWLLGAALLAFLIRNEEHSYIRQMVFVFYMLSTILMLIVELVQLVVGIGNFMVLVLIGIHGLFFILYLILFLENR